MRELLFIIEVELRFCGTFISGITYRVISSIKHFEYQANQRVYTIYGDIFVSL